jgi:hypothetical protein
MASSAADAKLRGEREINTAINNEKPLASPQTWVSISFAISVTRGSPVDPS